MICAYCKRNIRDCRMDKRGLCVKSPLSDGKAKRRTKEEIERDRKLGY